MQGMKHANEKGLRPRFGGRLRRGTSQAAVRTCGVDMSRLREALRQTEMLCGITDAQADELLHLMRGRTLKANATLYREGARGDSLVLVACGTVEVLRSHKAGHGTRELAVLQQPTLLGTEALKGVERRLITIRFRTDGIVFFLRLGAFAQWAAQQIPWCTPPDIPREADVIWIGSSHTRPRGARGMRCLQLHRLRAYVREVSGGRRTVCMARDDRDSAIAAFLLAQRGLAAHAVRNGKKGVIPEAVEGSAP